MNIDKMDHNQQQQQQQQSQQQQIFSRPIAPNPPTTTKLTAHPQVPTMYSNNAATINPHQQQNIPATTVVGNAMNSQVMGQLMTNPALAAVAAATPLLPPAAMITNPGAFITMPEYYQTQQTVVTGNPGAAPQDTQQQLTAKTSAAAINSSVAVPPQLVTSGQQNAQQQHVQPGSTPQSQAQTQLFAIPGVQYPTILPYGVSLPNPVLASTPGVNPLAPSSVQVHMAANAAASRAIASANSKPNTTDASNSTKKATGKRRTKDLTSEERAQQNRDRNREHARSTRLRKKAYVSKLKELVDGLHRERTEEVRQRRVAIQHLAETQDVRRAVVRSFLRFHASYETDKRKWTTLLEDGFWFKQPLTPYRYFRRSEIENVSKIHANKRAFRSLWISPIMLMSNSYIKYQDLILLFLSVITNDENVSFLSIGVSNNAWGRRDDR